MQLEGEPCLEPLGRLAFFHQHIVYLIHAWDAKWPTPLPTGFTEMLALEAGDVLQLQMNYNGISIASQFDVELMIAQVL